MAQVTPPSFGVAPELLRRVAERLKTLFDRESLGIWIQPALQVDKRRARPDLILGGPAVRPTVVRVLSWGRDGEDVAPAGKDFLRVGSADGAQRHRHPWEALAKERELLRAHLQRVPSAAGVEPRTVLWAPFLSAAQVKQLLAPDLERVDAVLSREHREIREAFLEEPGIPVATLRAAVEPQLHFFDLREPPEVPEPPRPEAAPELADWGFFLDRKQERMARELASPRTLVYGPAGSGKTVFLMARAQYWLTERPEARVLLTCYNASLSAHMRRSLILKGMDPEDEALTVLHYHDLCRDILELGPEFHEQAPEFYAALEPKVLKRLSAADEPPSFDLILVDEGQDFTRRMFEVLIRLLSPGGEITVVADPAQDIYLRFSESNLEPLGDYAVERLVDCYRNTAPIFALARSVIPAPARKALGLNRLELTRPEDLGRDGPPPEFSSTATLDAWLEHVTEACRRVQAAGHPLSQIALLYTDRHAVPEFPRRLKGSRWRAAKEAHRFAQPEEDEDTPSLRVGSMNPGESGPAPPPRHFAEALIEELALRDIPAEWITKDFETKAAFDIQRPRVAVSTIHSAKGMDFDTVLLIGAETLAPEDEKAAALLFAGMTRARERLEILYFEPRGWIPKLRQLAESLQQP